MNKFSLLIDKLGGRKFFLVLFVFLVTALMLYLNTVDKNQFVSLSKMLLLAYPVGNIGQSFVMNSFPPTMSPQEEELTAGRKFILIMVMFLVFVFFTFCNLITSDLYVEFTQWLVGIYITSNVAGKAVDNGMIVSVSKKE